MLKDRHGRIHNYLRISLTERCNLRCTYCMPENGVQLKKHSSYMTVEEVIRFAEFFVSQGVNKIRLTGGEPLVFKGFEEVLEALGKMDVELSLTTNGLLLSNFWESILNAGMKSINISLDTLQEERFEQITRRAGLEKVLQAIDQALEYGLNVKVNVVVIKGVNDDELLDFVEMAFAKPVAVRFIEFMPFDGNKWQWEKVMSAKEMLGVITSKYDVKDIVGLDRDKHFISRDYKLNQMQGSFGVISTMTDSFCGGCNRIRLTSDGHIKNCLFTGEETDLLSPMRLGQDLLPLVTDALWNKHAKNGGIDFQDPSTMHDHRSMISIGG